VGLSNLSCKVSSIANGICGQIFYGKSIGLRAGYQVQICEHTTFSQFFIKCANDERKKKGGRDFRGTEVRDVCIYHKTVELKRCNIRQQVAILALTTWANNKLPCTVVKTAIITKRTCFFGGYLFINWYMNLKMHRDTSYTFFWDFLNTHMFYNQPSASPLVTVKHKEQ